MKVLKYLGYITLLVYNIMMLKLETKIDCAYVLSLWKPKKKIIWLL